MSLAAVHLFDTRQPICEHMQMLSKSSHLIDILYSALMCTSILQEVNSGSEAGDGVKSLASPQWHLISEPVSCHRNRSSNRFTTLVHVLPLPIIEFDVFALTFW